MKRNIKLIKTYLKPLKGEQEHFYSEKLQKFKGNAKKTWGVMKEILGKCTTKPSTLPTKITVNKLDIFDKKKIADEFNKFLQTLELIWQIKFQMLQSDLILNNQS